MLPIISGFSRRQSDQASRPEEGDPCRKFDPFVQMKSFLQANVLVFVVTFLNRFRILESGED